MSRLRFLASSLVVAAFLIAGSFAWCQGSRADYERARRMPGLVRDKVLNKNLDEAWLDEERLIYRRQTGPDRWQFMIADGAAGKRRRAFDHDAAARAIEKKLGTKVDPEQLPFTRFTMDQGALIALVKGSDVVVRIRDSGRRVEDVPIETIPAFHLEPTRLRRSIDRGEDTGILFVNRNAAPVQIFWLDRSGGRKPYAVIQPGGSQQQHTYAGHVWLAVGDRGRELARFQARRDPGVAVIEQEPRVLPEGKPKRSPQISPDGRWEAFVREKNLFVRETASGKEHALAADGTDGNRYTSRMAWSPDSARLAVVREEPAQEHTIHLIESAPRDQVQPKLHSMQYLKPGDAIAHPRICLFDVDGHRAIPVDEGLFPNPWSISRMDWLSDGSEFTFLYNERGHQLIRLVALDARTGAARVAIEEKSRTFVDYANKIFLKRLKDGNEAIWMSERDGWNHLYLMDLVSGRVKSRITRGQWIVRRVDHVDEEKRLIWFRAMGVHSDQDPYHVHYGRVDFDGRDLVWLTKGDGTHRIEYSPGRKYFVDRYSRVDLPPVHELRRSSDGKLICRLEQADWTPLLETKWRAPERFSAPGRDGKTAIHGILLYPSNFDASKRYPVIESIYAGPHGFFVPKRFGEWYGSQEIAELGFIVVHIDGMGTNWRSKTFHDVCWKNLGDSGFADRIAWLEAAARTRPYLDLSRVGIYGGSAGGQSALRALLAHGGFYDAAVADCGCHDNRMDKIWWNELWMGWPIGPHYAEQSNVTNAHRLKGDLLLIVGELDRNVDPASTMQVVDALIRADRDFDLLLIPGAGHGAAESAYGRRRRQDFFVRSLLAVEPRWE